VILMLAPRPISRLPPGSELLRFRSLIRFVFSSNGFFFLGLWHYRHGSLISWFATINGGLNPRFVLRVLRCSGLCWSSTIVPYDYEVGPVWWRIHLWSDKAFSRSTTGLVKLAYFSDSLCLIYFLCVK